ncbi:MAG: hypothetical protein Q8R25_00605 [bacterium]|nr:hypothetical protein [bacterium]
MFIIDVIPISRGIAREQLSYFSSKDLAAGTVVSITVRNRRTSGIVVSSSSAAERKSELRAASFALKKATDLQAKSALLPELIAAASAAAEFHAATTGSVLHALGLPRLIESLPEAGPLPEATPSERHGGRFVLQSDDDDRFTTYRRVVREEFARHGSVFFIVPTAQDIPLARARLEKGIESYAFSVNSSMTSRQLGSAYRSILSELHAVLIIGTPQFLHIPRADVSTIIIERENSRSYKTMARPFLDFRVFAEKLAEALHSKIIFGDSIISVETYWRTHEGELQELAPLTMRRLSNARGEIVDMKRYRGGPKRITILSDELRDLLSHNRESSENLFIYAARRGISAITICGDCGTIVKCIECTSPMVLHSGSRGNFFLCHRCGSERTAEEFCHQCGSWRLVPLGIGIERVHAEIKNQFPDIQLFHIDKDVTPSHKRALDVATKFLATPGSILVGTEMALPYISRSIENAAVASIDSLFAVPDFRMHERIFSLLLKIRSIATQRIVIQTRNPGEAIFDVALKGNLADFYRSETEERKRFSYPPFTVLIQISIEGKKEKISEEMAALRHTFDPYRTDIFPTFIGKGRGVSAVSALVRIPRERWPEKKLIDHCRSLPPHITVKVNPESLM